MQPGGHAFRLAAPRAPGARGGQAEEVFLFQLVEVQHSRERFEDLL